MNWTWIVILFGFFSAVALFTVWADSDSDHYEPPSQMDEWDR